MLIESKGRIVNIGSTFGGNLVDMVRCRRILEIIESENLVDAAARQGAYLLAELRKLQSRFSAQAGALLWPVMALSTRNLPKQTKFWLKEIAPL